MYDYIKGLITYKSSDVKGCFATVETSGIGYSLEIMDRDFSSLPTENEELKIFTVLLHKEDKMSLCGFLKREDRDLFNVLTSVSGVGSKMALTLLNSFNVSDLIGFVIDGNFKELTRAKGVGPKLAQKIILELKDKLSSYKGDNLPRGNSSNVMSSQNAEDAQMVLLSLGYEKDEVSSAISRAIERVSHTSSAEEILKESLKILSV